MRIRRIAIKNIRSHTEKDIELGQDVTVILGANGAGKTTLLESIHIALRGTSFKGSDTEVLQKNTPWWRIDITFDDNSIRTVTFEPEKVRGRKQFTIDDKKSLRLSEKDKYPIVLFEPDDLRLLHGSPTRRRDFIDKLLSQIDSSYGTALRKYERALKQRNALLKQEFVNRDDVFVWNMALSQYGAEIVEKRIFTIERINSVLEGHYRDIAGVKDKVEVHYSHTSIDHSAQKILNELEAKFNYDAVVKHTSVGPHRHDIIFKFNNSPALSVASRGEIRSVMLALKRVEKTIIEELTGLEPIVLLDDVFSELDETRQQQLVLDGAQVVITSATYSGSYEATTINL